MYVILSLCFTSVLKLWRRPCREMANCVGKYKFRIHLFLHTKNQYDLQVWCKELIISSSSWVVTNQTTSLVQNTNNCCHSCGFTCKVFDRPIASSYPTKSLSTQTLRTQLPDVGSAGPRISWRPCRRRAMAAIGSNRVRIADRCPGCNIGDSGAAVQPKRGSCRQPSAACRRRRNYCCRCWRGSPEPSTCADGLRRNRRHLELPFGRSRQVRSASGVDDWSSMTGRRNGFYRLANGNQTRRRIVERTLPSESITLLVDVDTMCWGHPWHHSTVEKCSLHCDQFSTLRLRPCTNLVV